ncbi:uncharacterized protein A4U43_C07F14880 [Asparagus officinalis]|uniref:Pectinesterase catalytic domain-containing protein n=2 Tax=Asparagus officinalis TaxID=4686 RepID=A0A5P1ECB0_ASPOF|nr:uncharacterized protein A4U43_C07F14880 [Asparagus officinalis]
MAPDFMARDIGFENTGWSPKATKPSHSGAKVTKPSSSTATSTATQDTLYASANANSTRDCTITRYRRLHLCNAFALFQNCNIIARKPATQPTEHPHRPRQQVGEREHRLRHRTSCSVFAEPALVPFIAQNPSFLGRPWKERARTIYMQSYIGDLIHTDGWMPWENEPKSINTCLYSEIDNYGPGAKKEGRVKWPGIKDINIKHADMYTLDVLYQGAEWVKKSGAAFSPGMLPPSSPNQPAPPAPMVTQMQVDPIITGPIPPKRRK